MTIRMFAAGGGQVSATVPPPPAPPQRAYSAGGQGIPFVDVPGDASGDAAAIASSGFVYAGSSGPTSARPPNPKGGDWHIDLTLGFAVVSDGASWRNPITGVIV